MRQEVYTCIQSCANHVIKTPNDIQPAVTILELRKFFNYWVDEQNLFMPHHSPEQSASSTGKK
jgi:hypothetical protein